MGQPVNYWEGNFSGSEVGARTSVKLGMKHPTPENHKPIKGIESKHALKLNFSLLLGMSYIYIMKYDLM